MQSVGIICEYNPFHNGHLYHLNTVKKSFPDCAVVLIMSGYFTQRGDISILDKWTKTSIALQYGVDVVVELPFVFATQSADMFARGAIGLLNSMHVDYLVFGSECNDISLLTQIASCQVGNVTYDRYIKQFLKEGYNYPTAISKSLEKLGFPSITSPNDLLGISYIKEIIRLNSSIKPFCIQRTNDYHSTQLNEVISSASGIRSSLKKGINIENQVPSICYDSLPKDFSFEDNYYFLLKYVLFMEKDLSIYHGVDQAMISRIKKGIFTCNSLDELILNIKMRRYTYSRIKRMLLHIACHLTCAEGEYSLSYIRILGFSKFGQEFLHEKKKKINLPLVMRYCSKYPLLAIELRVAYLYGLIMNDYCYVTLEYQHQPIQYFE